MPFWLLLLLAQPLSTPDRLDAEIRTIAAAAGGTVGVSIVRLESGERVSVRGGERFPMASVFKLPLAVEILHRADAGSLPLDRVVRFTAADLSPGHSPLAAQFPRGGEQSVEGLLERMLVESDNTAADLLLPLAGGPAGVTARLRALGIDGIRVDRSEVELAWSYFGVDSVPLRADWSLAKFQRRIDAVPPDRRRAAAARFLSDSRDTATPEALASLLERVHRRDLVSPESSERLLAWMRRTTTGPARIKRLLPPSAEVAHRTGLCGDTAGINACTNDAGIVTLPNGAGHLAVVVLIRGSDRTLAAREDAIARVARTAYDHWGR